MSARVAVVGAGSVARRHVEVLTGLGATVTGVLDPAPGAAARLAADCGATATEDLDELLDRSRPDAVYVCVPPFAHGEPERAALARGLPLFVEKPLGVDLAVAEEVAELVDRTGVVTGTGYHWRCLDVVEVAAQRLAERPPLLATGYWLDKRPPVAWWGRTSSSGGQVVEQLTHVVDLARVLLGEATEVFAAGARALADGQRTDDVDGERPVDPEDTVDDATAAVVRFASGAVATLVATSTLGAKHRAALHTFGSGLATEVSEVGLVLDDGRRREELRPGEDPRVSVDREFLEAVRGDRDGTRAPYAEALRTHRLACAVAESARTREPVRLGAVTG